MAKKYYYTVTEGTYTSADGTRYRKGDRVELSVKTTQINLLPVSADADEGDVLAVRRGAQPEVSTTVANKGKAEPVVIQTAVQPKRAVHAETPVPVITDK